MIIVSNTTATAFRITGHEYALQVKSVFDGSGDCDDARDWEALKQAVIAFVESRKPLNLVEGEAAFPFELDGDQRFAIVQSVDKHKESSTTVYDVVLFLMEPEGNA